MNYWYELLVDFKVLCWPKLGTYRFLICFLELILYHFNHANISSYYFRSWSQALPEVETMKECSGLDLLLSLHGTVILLALLASEALRLETLLTISGTEHTDEHSDSNSEFLTSHPSFTSNMKCDFFCPFFLKLSCHVFVLKWFASKLVVLIWLSLLWNI